jgi:hypothetical protein
MKSQSFKNILCVAVGLGILITFLGCATAPEPLVPGEPSAKTGSSSKGEAKETYYTHTVKWPGESLSIVAGWYTGDVQNWKEIAEANPDINPNRIHEGTKLLIPDSLMTTKAPLTKDYVDGYYPKPKKPAPKPAPSRPKDDEPVLYGPKQYPSK